MSIAVPCHCGHEVAVPDSLGGKRVKYPSCGQPVSVPTHSQQTTNGGDGSTAIAVKCTCGKSFSVPAKLAGKSVKCPSCKGRLEILPSNFENLSTAANTSDKVEVRCKCGKLFNVNSDLAGKTLRCPACRGTLTCPTPKQSKTVPDSESDFGLDSAGTGLLDGWGDVGSGVASLFAEVDPVDLTADHRCPSCKSAMAVNAILCVKCGYNIKSGRQLEPNTTAIREAARAINRPPIGSRVGGKPTERPKRGGQLPPKEKELGLGLILLGLFPVAMVIGFYVIMAMADDKFMSTKAGEVMIPVILGAVVFGAPSYVCGILIRFGSVIGTIVGILANIAGAYLLLVGVVGTLGPIRFLLSGNLVGLLIAIFPVAIGLLGFRMIALAISDEVAEFFQNKKAELIVFAQGGFS